MPHFLRESLRGGLFIWLLLFATYATAASSYEIYIVVKPDKVGDGHQAQGVVKAFEKASQSPPLSTHVYAPEDFENFLHTLDEPTSAQRVLLTFGVEGSKIIQHLAQACDEHKKHCDIIKVHLSHQFLPDHHPALLEKAQLICLPSYAIPDDFQKEIEAGITTLVATFGVPHNLGLEGIQQAYHTHKHIFPKASAYLGIILGGDAPDSNDTMRYFTLQDAKNLASIVIPYAKKHRAHILLMNGPRTGKHNPRTGTVYKHAHHGQLDYITAHFANLLHAELGESEVTLYDYQFEQTFNPYQATLGLLFHTQSPFLVSGDSATQISEGADNLPGQVYVYRNTAMNESHEAHLNMRLNAGHVFPADALNDPNPSQDTTFFAPMPVRAADQVARALLRYLEKNR